MEQTLRFVTLCLSEMPKVFVCLPPPPKLVTSSWGEALGPPECQGWSLTWEVYSPCKAAAGGPLPKLVLAPLLWPWAPHSSRLPVLPI